MNTVFNETERRAFKWAQDEFDRSKTITSYEIEGKLVKMGMKQDNAIGSCLRIIRNLRPPNSGFMEERPEFGKGIHAEMKREIFKWIVVQPYLKINKIWIDQELPINHYSGFKPRPDIFIETEKERIWIECQTPNSADSLRKKIDYARQFAAAYDLFILYGKAQKNYLVKELEHAVNSMHKKFIYKETLQ